MFTFEYSAQFGSEIPKTRPWWDIEARFLVSVESGDVDCTRHLLSLDHGGQKIDPDIRIYNGPAGSRLGKPAICSAIERGHYDMTKLLIDFGASVNLGDIFSPIHYAVKSLNLDILRLLISNRADVNVLSSFGDSALHLAAQQPFSEIVQELIDGGAELDKEDSRGRSPLSLACIHNQSRVVEIFLNAGANVNHEDKDGDSPLLHTIKSGLCLNSNIVGTLLKAGANPNHMNSFGQTPLTFTVRRCSETNLEGQVAVKQLIDHNCHVNVQEAGPFGENAIHLAISRGQDRITEMLIRAGCDLSCVNQFGATPLERVCKEGKIDLVKLMLAAGSPVNLSQSYWDYFECYQSDDEPLRETLRSHANTTQNLKHFCRVRLRNLWGRRSDEIVEKINLPSCIKEYLRLNSL